MLQWFVPQWKGCGRRKEVCRISLWYEHKWQKGISKPEGGEDPGQKIAAAKLKDGSDTGQNYVLRSQIGKLRKQSGKISKRKKLLK